MPYHAIVHRAEHCCLQSMMSTHDSCPKEAYPLDCTDPTWLKASGDGSSSQGVPVRHAAAFARGTLARAPCVGGRSIRVTHNPELLNRSGFAQPRGGPRDNTGY